MQQSLHGDCEISYTVSDDLLVKSVSHMRDCKNRRYKLLDDYRGHRCDMDWKEPQKKESTDGLFSVASTTYKLKKNGGSYTIESMETSQALISQLYQTEGMTQHVRVLVSSKLVAQRSSSGDISASGETIDNLYYEFADSEYKWNQDRDLKAREPFFSMGSYFEDDQQTLKAALMKTMNVIYSGLHSHNNPTDHDEVQKKHKNNIESAYMILFAMDYSTLKSVHDDLFLDKSDKGIWMANMFNEYLGNTGTTASAMVVRDLILENKFDNHRDAARVLSAVAFHIRRPNTQLVREYEKLLTHDAEAWLKMAIPLSFSHLVKMTCARAGKSIFAYFFL